MSALETINSYFKSIDRNISISAILTCDIRDCSTLIDMNKTGKKILQVFLVQVENQDDDVTYLIHRQSETDFNGKLMLWGLNPDYKDVYNNVLIKFDDLSYMMIYTS